MGREIKRVPETFAWPLYQVWEGYLLPERLREAPCAACTQSVVTGRHSTGTTAAREWVSTLTHLLLMLANEAPARKNQRLGSSRRGELHPWLQSMNYRPRVPPSDDIIELTSGLAGRMPSAMGHDSIDYWHAADAIVAAAGLDPEVWGICTTCHGEGVTERYEGQHAEAEAWVPYGPPAGECWQLWETVSEGSPVSPPFATPEELAVWMSSLPRDDMSFAEYETALAFITGPGWAPSMVMTGGKVFSGLQHAGEHAVAESTESTEKDAE